MKKLAIVTTHPIQYNAPFFKLLNERGKVYPKVFYTWPQAIDGFDDPDFGKKVEWDIPLLGGYAWEAVENISKNPSSKNWNGIYCPNLIGQIRNFAPDAILVYGWNLKSHFKILRYFKGKVPLWFTGDSTLLDERPGLKMIVRRLALRWVYTHIDKAFYVGANNKAYFEAHGLKQDQLVFFPHAIDNERFADSKEKRYEEKAQEWRKELGYTGEDTVVLFAGKFESKKNPMLLVRAIQQMNLSCRQAGKSADQEAYLLIVGNGPLEQELKYLSKGDSHIQFLPFQNQSLMPVVYRLGNIFCLPSKGPGETWGLGVNEALACARPAIASNKVGCASDLINPGITGQVIQHNTTGAFISAYTNLVNSDLKHISKNCLDLVSKWSFLRKCQAIEQAI